ncbi:uncharacterized protein LOC126902368 [Daktulosphaira vitifoliae]|uniref:uncharacterized protein LOC126902368 n=1 Tax=Daktulosphaira vitifoliae TaxID=58002 RepID=UPI0021AA9A73|nr:uncharacterized protein LOC126902368 [Daktulosphaira vitifoliae]
MADVHFTGAAQATSSATVPHHHSVKRKANNSRVKSKRLRIQLPNAKNFIEIDSALERGAVWFYRKNVENFASYRDFLRVVKSELVAKLGEIAAVRPIKYNLKLEATYHIPRSEAPPKDCAFKT